MQKPVSLLCPVESPLTGGWNDNEKVEVAIRAVIPPRVGSKKINPGRMEAVAQAPGDMFDSGFHLRGICFRRLHRVNVLTDRHGLIQKRPGGIGFAFHRPRRESGKLGFQATPVSPARARALFDDRREKRGGAGG